MNVFETFARGQKCDRLLAKIDEVSRSGGLDPRFHAPQILASWERANDWHWNRLAVLCGKRPPSEVTRGMVLDELRRRAEPSFVVSFDDERAARFGLRRQQLYAFSREEAEKIAAERGGEIEQL